MAGDEQAIAIYELEGDKRIVILGGSDRPPELVQACAIRSVRTQYPGANRTSTQIMGVDDEDMTIEGQLRDVWGGAAGWATAQAAALRALGRGRRFCQMSWGTATVVRGYVRRVEIGHVADGIKRYKVDFQVDESDEADVTKPVAFARAPSSRDVRSGLDVLGQVVDTLALVAADVGVAYGAVS